MPRQILFRFVFAGMSLTAILAQFLTEGNHGLASAVNFFSFFTSQSNIFASAVLIAGACFTLSGRESPSWLEKLRGAAVVYMLTTAIVYNILLRAPAPPLMLILDWPDTIEHDIFPIAVAADWLLVKPRITISAAHALLWMVFPLVWLIYTLSRGPAAHWYPYTFLQPGPGYGEAAIYSAAILILISSLCIVVRTLATKMAPALNSR